MKIVSTFIYCFSGHFERVLVCLFSLKQFTTSRYKRFIFFSNCPHFSTDIEGLVEPAVSCIVAVVFKLF